MKFRLAAPAFPTPRGASRRAESTTRSARTLAIRCTPPVFAPSSATHATRCYDFGRGPGHVGQYAWRRRHDPHCLLPCMCCSIRSSAPGGCVNPRERLLWPCWSSACACGVSLLHDDTWHTFPVLHVPSGRRADVAGTTGVPAAVNGARGGRARACVRCLCREPYAHYARDGRTFARGLHGTSLLACCQQATRMAVRSSLRGAPARPMSRTDSSGPLTLAPRRPGGGGAGGKLCFHSEVTD